MKFFFELCFDGDVDANLVETRFKSPIHSDIFTSTRGKTPARRATGSFEWSAAVRSMALLFVRFKQNKNAVIEGELARPLDYALSKKPLWIKEMFGVSKNESLLRRLFIRNNPEGKRPGSVTVSLNTEFWTQDKINLKYFAALITLPEVLKILENRLISQLQQSWGSPLNLLRGGLEHELRLNLQNNDILGSSLVKQHTQKLYQSILPKKLNAGSLLESLAAYKVPNQSGSTRKDLICYLNNSLPLSIEIPAAVTVASAMFLRLKDVGAYVDFNFRYSTSFQLVKSLLDGDCTRRPDFIVLGTVPGMHFAGQSHKHEYEFLMPIGFGSSWVIEGENKKLDSACYFKEEPMNSMIAVEQFGIKSSRHKLHSEILEDVHNSNLLLQAIVISPFGWIASKLGRNAHCLNTPGPDGLMYMLFVRKELRSDPRTRALQMLLHRIESDFIFDPHSIRKSSTALINQTDLCFQLMTEGGLSSFQTSSGIN